MRKDWIKIKNYYISHDISLEELAKKYKASISAVRLHSSQEKWSKLKKKKHIEIEQKVEKKITEKIVDRKVKANEQHIELFDKGLIVANKLLDLYLNELNSNKKRKKLANAYNLDFVMKAIANAQKGQRMALNIDKEQSENAEPEIAVIEGLDFDKI